MLTEALDYTKSPFRSTDVVVRKRGAELMIALLEAEREGVERRIKSGTFPKSHGKTRLGALARALKSWEAYVDEGYRREPRATTIPGKTRLL